MAKTLFQLHKVLWKRMFSENKAMLASTILIGIYALLGLLSLCSLVCWTCPLMAGTTNPLLCR